MSNRQLLDLKAARDSAMATVQLLDRQIKRLEGKEKTDDDTERRAAIKAVVTRNNLKKYKSA